MVMQSRIIVLNGAGSVGKSSAAKALQKLALDTLTVFATHLSRGL